MSLLCTRLEVMQHAGATVVHTGDMRFVPHMLSHPALAPLAARKASEVLHAALHIVACFAQFMTL